jgi:hypothetical protein
VQRELAHLRIPVEKKMGKHQVNFETASLCKVNVHTYHELKQKPLKKSNVRNLKMNLCKVNLHIHAAEQKPRKDDTLERKKTCLCNVNLHYMLLLKQDTNELAHTSHY